MASLIVAAKGTVVCGGTAKTMVGSNGAINLDDDVCDARQLYDTVRIL